MKVLGQPVNRVDGKLKVTGGAKYAADHTPAGVAYGVPVVSTIARGVVKSIDASKAEKHPGFVALITHQNVPQLQPPANDFGSWTKLGEARMLFADNKVDYAGQYLGVVVADTLERATAAAALIDVTYDVELPVVESAAALHTLFVP